MQGLAMGEPGCDVTSYVHCLILCIPTVPTVLLTAICALMHSEHVLLRMSQVRLCEL